MYTVNVLPSKKYLKCRIARYIANSSRLMDTVFQNINCVFVYLDDILIASSNPHQHIEDLHIVCGRLKQFGLTIRLEKCIFGVSKIDFLGHEICKNGSIPQLGKVKPISDFPQPNTVKSLQGFPENG